ncbi:MAG: tetratricopeptide repeat protein [Pseudomonadota bacterium]
MAADALTARCGDRARETKDASVPVAPRWTRRLKPALIATGILVAGAVAAIIISRPVVAQKSDAAAQHPALLSARSQLGSYLAGKLARSANDTAAAAQLFSRALADDPKNPSILAQAFLMQASEGRIEEATRLARQLVQLRKDNRLAQLWLGVDAFRAGDLRRADKHFLTSSVGPIAELTGQIARAWTAQKANDTPRALSRLKSSNRAEWAQFYSDYHRALIADLGNRPKTATKTFRSVLARDPRQARNVITAATAAAARGKRDLAIRMIEQHIADTDGVGHASVRDLQTRLRAGGPVQREVATAEQGLAELFYVLGEALSNDGGGTQLGTLYLQLALHLRPDFEFAQAALAHVYERQQQYLKANAVYGRMSPASPLATTVAIRKALNLNALDRVDDARKALLALLEQDKTNIRAADALASMLRSRKRYKEAIRWYTHIIDQVGEPQRRHWRYWYARGTCYERTKQWPLAEVDLLKARTLRPNEPMILNYLGYSWVDQNKRLNEGLEMIKKAVALKPDDGYIVDSLGWAHYRLGNMKLALKHLERAVELQPEDPILNDHLGDVLWRTGRHREARYQWSLALSFNPEPDEVVKIRQKLAKGLDDGAEVARTSQDAAATTLKKSVR